MERSLKIAWIKRIAESSNASWKIIPNQALSRYGGPEFLIECDYDPKLLNLENLPEFNHAILNYWHDFRRLTCDKQISIKKQIIWNNRNICIDGKPIYIKSWCINGIRCIEDLLNVNLKFLVLSEMKEKYNFKFPFTTYYGLLRAIPLNGKVHYESKQACTVNLKSAKHPGSFFPQKKPILPYLTKPFQRPLLKAEFYIMGSPKRKFLTSTCSRSKS